MAVLRDGFDRLKETSVYDKAFALKIAQRDVCLDLLSNALIVYWRAPGMVYESPLMPVGCMA